MMFKIQWHARSHQAAYSVVTRPETQCGMLVRFRYEQSTDIVLKTASVSVTAEPHGHRNQFISATMSDHKGRLVRNSMLRSINQYTYLGGPVAQTTRQTRQVSLWTNTRINPTCSNTSMIAKQHKVIVSIDSTHIRT